MKIKRIIAGIAALAMSLTMFAGLGMTAGAEEMTPPSKLVSVCYSPELDIYTAVAAKSSDSGDNLIIYSSGDGKNWVKSDAEIDDKNTRIGAVVANGYYINPNMIVWNDKEHKFVMGDMANVYTSSDGINWENIGTPKKYSDMDGTTETGNIELYNMYFDGSNYWATTRINNEVARTIDGDPLKWYSVTLDISSGKALSAITGTDSGKIYVSSAMQDQGAYITNDNGFTWNLAIGGNVGPYKTLGSVYSKYLDRLILVGVQGNRNTLDNNSTASINFIDPATNTSPEGNKLEMKNLGENKGSPGPAGDVAVSEDGSQIIVVFMSGDIYTVDTKVTQSDNDDSEEGDDSEGDKKIEETPISRARQVSNYVKVEPKSDADDIGTMPLTGIVKGKNGYVAIGGTPGHSNDKTSPAEGGAVFIPNDPTQGYEKAVFYTNDTAPEATSAYIKGETDEIEIERTSNSAQFEVIVRDQSGAPMENTGKTFTWSIDGNPTGVTVSNNGVVTVSSDAQSGYIRIVAKENGGDLTADKTILLTSEPFPASIAINGNDRKLVKNKSGEREYSFNAIVSDNYGRVMEDEEVEWRIDELDGSGVTVSESGDVTVSPDAQNGTFKLTAVSKTDSNLESSIELTITSIDSITIKGPSELGDINNINIKKLLAGSPDTEGNGEDRTYTFSSTVFDADAAEIRGEKCVYSINGKSDYSENGITLTTNEAGNAVITVSTETVTQTLILTASSVNNDNIKAEYELNIIKSLVENSGFRKGIDEGSGWTVISGDVTPSISGKFAMMRMKASRDNDEAVAKSDEFPVEAGKEYAFGFRSKVSDGMSNSSSMYATLMFCNADGEPIDFADVYDENIESKKDPESESVTIKGHQTAMEYYSTAKAPDDAVTAYIVLGVHGPITNADFYDIGVYATDLTTPAKPVYAYNFDYDEENIVVEVTIPDNARSDDVMYVAAYNEEKALVKVYLVKDIQAVNSFETPENTSEVKVFIWDKNMAPLA